MGMQWRTVAQDIPRTWSVVRLLTHETVAAHHLRSRNGRLEYERTPIFCQTQKHPPTSPGLRERVLRRHVSIRLRAESRGTPSVTREKPAFEVGSDSAGNAATMTFASTNARITPESPPTQAVSHVRLGPRPWLRQPPAPAHRAKGPEPFPDSVDNREVRFSLRFPSLERLKITCRDKSHNRNAALVNDYSGAFLTDAIDISANRR